MSRPARLVYNPKSGRRRQAALVESLVVALRGGGWTAEPVATRSAGDATALAAEAAREGRVEAVFALGGDGTVREVAAGLLGSPVALGVLPAGTTNVVAIALGLPPTALGVAALSARLVPREIDVGLCNGQPFLMQASVGLEAAIMRNLDGVLKARLGKLGVVLQAVAIWWRYRYPEIRLEADGRELRACNVIVCNMAEFGGPYRLVPDGRFDDGQLELLTLRGHGRLAALSFWLDLVVRRAHVRRHDVAVAPVRQVRLFAPAETAVQIDGDGVAMSWPVEVQLAAHRLRVLAPPGAP